MKITIDTGSGDEQDDLLARAYIAAVVGPFRRPHGKPGSTGVLGAGVVRTLVTNRTSKNVLFVQVSNLGAQINLAFSLQASSGAQSAGFAPQSFILFPGEALTVVGGIGGASLVWSEITF